MKYPLWKAVIPVVVGVTIAVFPAPQGLEQNAWFYFALFVSVVLGLIFEPIPSAAIGVIGVTLAASFRLVHTPLQISDPAFDLTRESIKWALSGFGNTTVWLIFGAFMFAMGYAKSGLGRRIALVLVKRLGKRTLGLGYAITFADLILAPFTPSNTARSGGTIFPIIQNIPGLYGSEPGDTARKIGSYLMWTAFAATCLTSSLFLTSMAPNLLAVDLAQKTVGVEISWMQWFLGFLPMGALLVLLLPYIIYRVYPPKIRTSVEVPDWARQELTKMGKISYKEITMAALVFLALVLWIFGGNHIHPTTVALAVIALMLITRVITWDDILRNKPAWNVLVWFATLVTLADGLNRVGFVTWFAKGVAKQMTGISPIVVMVILVALYFCIHYMFASITAQVTAILPVILAAGAAIPGMPIMAFTLLLCCQSGIMGIITPYATGPAPIYYGSGYISRKDFWTLGLVFGAIFLLALLIIGVPYLTALYSA
ncbi:MAG: anion permease [Candidatus Aminicenantes bacterium]|jgi:L-tartrate/succinate antiporter